MKTTHPETGEEVEVFTAEEVAARETAKAEEATKALVEEKTKLETELAEARRVAAEKTTHFRKFNDLTEEERKAHSENEVTLIRRADQLQEELDKIQGTLKTKEEAERTATVTSAIKQIAGDNEEIKKQLEEAYKKLSGMPETTPEERFARVQAAARLEGIQVGEQPNPLTASFNGEPPKHKDAKEFVETEKGKSALETARTALGITPPSAQ